MTAVVDCLTVAILLLIGAFVLRPFVERRLICFFLEARMRYRSGQVRQLRAELLTLSQTREHWSRLDAELSPLDDAGRREWLVRMRADSENLEAGEDNADR